MKKFLICIAFIVTSTVPLLAQSETSDSFKRVELNWNPISFARIEGMNGWGSQFGVAVKVAPAIAIVGDFAGHRNNDLGTSLDLYTYRVGPRFYNNYGSKVRTFAHVLVGGAQARESLDFGGVTTSQSINGFSLTVGGRLDVAINHWFTIRAGQLDYDYSRFQGTNLDGIRVGGGVVFKMGQTK